MAIIPSDAGDRRWCVMALDATEALYDRTFISEDHGVYAAMLAATGLKSRYLLRAIVALHDANLPVEISTLFRALLEAHITLRWIENAPQVNIRRWALEDTRSRLAAANALISHGDDPLSSQTRADLNARQGALRSELEELGFDWRARTNRYPSIAQMANTAGVMLAYDSVYRMESQIGTHLRTLGLDRYIDAVRHGWRLRTTPRVGGPVMRVCATLYMDVLDTIGRLYPNLRLRGWRAVQFRDALAASLGP